MRVYSIVFLFLFVSPSLFGQDTHSDSFFDVPFTLFKTDEDTISFVDLQALDFKPKSQFSPSTPDDIYWARMDFEGLDTLLSSKKWYLQIGILDKAEIFFKTDGNVQSEILGAFQLNQDYTGEFSFDKNHLINERYLYLKFSILSDNISLRRKKFVFYGEQDNQIQENYVFVNTYKTHNLIYLFLGLASVGFVMALSFFRVHKRKEYLYYALYVLGLMISLWRIPSSFYHQYIGLYSFYNFVFDNALDLTIAMFYLLFARYFLNTSKLYPFFDKTIGIYLVGLFSLLIIDSLVIFLGYYSFHLILISLKLSALFLLEIIGVFYLYKNRKDKLTWFILSGGILFALGSIFAFLFKNSNFLKAAAFTEIFVFFLALGYKIQQEEKIKRQVQQTAIANYKSLLRSQINPHFIFNALNSIQNLIVRDNRTSALNYLGKFSKLLRTNLESSIEQVLTLDEEIKFLETYLELEALRFDDAFEYTVEVEQGISPEEIIIPQLMIQPFVENALLHGLLPKKGDDKILTIRFKIDDSLLICTIDDNGIGRKAAKQMKQNIKNRKSRGMEVTQKRIEALYADQKEKNQLIIKDKVDENGNAHGTTVIIKIPLIN